jgi:hypothetical protein
MGNHIKCYKLEFRYSKDNGNADALSRLPLPEFTTDSNLKENETTLMVSYIVL